MHYLYHSVPIDMSGAVLEPLNILKHTKPELYAQKVQKYHGREHVMERHVPLLNCLWNDVLHLSPVEPRVLKQALLEAGREDGTFRFYQIDPNTLELENTAVYLFRTLGKVIQPADAEFITFSPKQLKQWQAVPDRTKQYFKDHYSAGTRPLLFYGIPQHTIQRDNIDRRTKNSDGLKLHKQKTAMQSLHRGS